MISVETVPGVLPVAEQFLRDVLAGLRSPQKSIPCKYLYDERGSHLFELICELPEYYPTRVELSIMVHQAAEMAALLGPRCLVVELGTGSGRKTRLLLEHMEEPAGYIPVDIAGAQLAEAAADLRRRFPGLHVTPLQADFTEPFALPGGGAEPRRRAVYFPGSTIGNLHPPEAVALLARLAERVGPGGALLIGVDLRKDPGLLERAYDDARGVTAAFNLNLLARVNRELGGDFRLSRFAHRAFFEHRRSRIEMHLVSRQPQRVMVAGESFAFEEGETIHTECSYKYGRRELAALAGRAGWRLEKIWTDEGQLFSVQYLVVSG